MIGICIYVLITIIALVLVYNFGLDEDDKKEFDSCFQVNIRTSVACFILLIIAGLPAIVYGIILAIKEHKS